MAVVLSLSSYNCRIPYRIARVVVPVIFRVIARKSNTQSTQTENCALHFGTYKNNNNVDIEKKSFFPTARVRFTIMNVAVKSLFLQFWTDAGCGRFNFFAGIFCTETTFISRCALAITNCTSYRLN